MIDEKKLIESLRASLNNGRETLPIDLIIECIEEQEKIGEWIPCSERLPDQGGDFTDILITCESISDGVFVQSAEFYLSTWGDPVFDALYNYRRVLAWMTPPEPYKGE